jgi:L-ascorbate metabolism protein UlaG (beta-lactamase superfamily)
MKKVLLFLFLSPIMLLAVSIYVRSAPKALKNYLVIPETSLEPNELSVQFLGNTNLLFSDGETHILTDGFFSRPSAYAVLNGKVSPNREVVIEDLKNAHIDQIDALIPLHSHFDHAMDAGLVTELTGAKLLGSSSTINIGKGYGLPDNRMQIPPLNEPVFIGKFKLTFIASRHWQYPDKEQRDLLLDQDIKAPIVPPASIHDYKEGISYTLLIEHGSTKIAVQGSAGFRKGAIPDFDADILFLSIAGLESMDKIYNQNYQKHVVEAVQPEVLVPIHWDDFTVPLSDGLKTTHLLFNSLYGSDLGEAFEIVEQNNLSRNRKIKVLPLWEPISIKSLLN